jgi:hypothetical protein
MVETINHFLERCYVNFIDGYVFVFRETLGKGDPERWDMQTSKNYIKYLEGKWDEFQ